VTELRTVAVERRTAIAASDRDPLNFLIDTVWDESIDRNTRLSAAAIVLPFLHPKLSSTTVSASHTVTKIDAAQLLDRIADRIARLAQPAAIDAEAAPAEVPGTAATD
jgi:hypothetical protein